MIVPRLYPGHKTERVCTQKLLFATARTISAVVGLVNVMPNRSASETNTFKKYGKTTPHHARIRFIVLSPQVVTAALPVTMSLTVSAQCRLYGTTRSTGSSW
jgi:magnesium-transporting ATPase (P-type)